MTADDRTSTEFWDDRYGEKDQIWSGSPNEALVREAGGLTPGSALELGCGEGADAIWLAEQGWKVTATDVSGVALERAARHARERGVTVDFERHDFAESFPSGSFDLVTAFFLHSPVDMPRAEILRSAAAAVAPRGVLLIVGHAGPPSWEDAPNEHAGHGEHAGHCGHGEDGGHGERGGQSGHGEDGRHGGHQHGEHQPGERGGHQHGGHGGQGGPSHHDVHFPTPDEVLEELELPAGEWEVLVSDTYAKHLTGPDGAPATRPDNTLKVRRLS